MTQGIPPGTAEPKYRPACRQHAWCRVALLSNSILLRYALIPPLLGEVYDRTYESRDDMDGRRQRLANFIVTFSFAILWLWIILIIYISATSSAKQTATLSTQSEDLAVLNALLVAAPLVMVGISLLRRPIPTGLILIVLTTGVLGILASFSYVYWQIGTTANFNIQLTHFDGWYIALGMFTASGTGNIIATSERAREIQTLQMIFDMAIVVFVAGILVARFSEGLPSRRRTASPAHHTETANSGSPEEKA